MISLYNYIAEECSTPGNTMGMGDPKAPDGSTNGSEPLSAKSKKQKKSKSSKKKGEEE